ncbi:zwei Ig domain protein zig-8-like [Littorina saxatilis]|uniref:zwei Ig domain protein zig-8-like n=1 Tax=Littorina saxatilis TaxID=31220 RepID=UPI0038B5A041
MVWVRIPWHDWRAWINCSLPYLLLIMDLIVSTASIHDSIPPPKFLEGKSEVTVRPGEVAILPCSVQHLGTKQVAWRRIDADDFLTIGEMTWIDDDKIAVEHTTLGKDSSIWNLIIDKVAPDDAGVYECQVTSKYGSNKLVTLSVVGRGVVAQQAETSTARQANPFKSPIKRCGVRSPTGCLISMEGKRYVDLGERIHLICNASGGPRIPEEIDWFKDGDMIDSFKYPHVKIEKRQSFRDKAFISELIIDRAKLTDKGEYVCRSSRDNIVNMIVTVLRAESPNRRRGTNMYTDDYDSSASCVFSVHHILHVHLAALLATYIFFTWMLQS